MGLACSSINKYKNKKQYNWNDLSKNTISLILNFLTLLDLASLRIIQKRLQNIKGIFSNLLIYSKIITCFESEQILNLVYKNQVKTIIFEYEYHELQMKIISKFAHLEILKLNYIIYLKKVKLQNSLKYLQHLKYLKYLEINNCCITSIDLEYLSGLVNLQELVFQDCSISVSSFNTLINVQKLILNNCIIFDKTSEYFLKIYKNINELVINSCSIFDNSLHHLGIMTNLKALTIIDYGLIIRLVLSSECLQYIANMEKLEYLHLSCRYMTKDNLEYLINLTKLKCIKLCFSNGYTMGDNLKYLYKMKQLTSLSITIDECDKLHGINYLVNLNLQELYLINFCLTIDNIKIIATLNLRKLTLHNCIIPYNGLKYLEKCKNLQYLDLSCLNVTNKELKCIANMKNLQNSLEYISVHKCYNVSLNGLKHFKKLRSLKQISTNYVNKTELKKLFPNVIISY
jgi:hypothetical protein